MRLDNNNQGEGKLSVATKVIPAGDEIILEDCGSQPVMLKGIKQEK